MSSHYKKEVTVRKYKYYTNDDLFKCLEDVKSKKLTHNLKPGKPFFFSKLEEAGFVKSIIQLSHFGFPIGKEDVSYYEQYSSGKK